MLPDFVDVLRGSLLLPTKSSMQAQQNAQRAAQKAAQEAQAQAAAERAQKEAEAAQRRADTQQKINDFLSKLREATKSLQKKDEIEPLQDPSQLGYTGYDVNSDTYFYTYKPGDTFGQVISDLGLKTDAGLWGADGDVAYYTQQLIDQGALDARGNIPIGTTIRLRKRRTPQAEVEEVVVPNTSGQANIGRNVQGAQYPALQQINRAGARQS